MISTSFHFYNSSIFINVNILAISVILKVKDFSGFANCATLLKYNPLCLFFVFCFILNHDLQYTILENLRQSNHVQEKVEKMVNYTFCRCERGVYAYGFDKTPKHDTVLLKHDFFISSRLLATGCSAPR